MPLKPTKNIWFNNEFIRWEDANTHVLTHALHYGSGVFEGIRAYETASGPAIFKAKEQFIEAKDLWPEIDLLKSAIDNKNINASLNTLKKLVPEWKSSPKKIT